MSADFVWNEAAAEQIRVESENAMKQQISNMQSTVSAYQSIAANQGQLAAAEEHIAATAMKTETYTNSEGESCTRQVPDWEKRAEAAAKARDYRSYEAALYGAVGTLTAAIGQLEQAISDTNNLFAQLRDQAQSTDLSYAQKTESINEEILEFTRKMQAVHDSFNESFPFETSLSGLAALKDKVQSAILGIIDAAKLAGEQVSCIFSTDPVNLSTGNFIFFKDDIEIPGRFPLIFKRFYNSIGETNGILGLNWTHSFNIVLRKEGETAHITFGDGHLEIYQALEDGHYAAPLEHNNILFKSEDGWALTLPSMEQYLFDNEGALQSITDLNGNCTAFKYAEGLLIKVENSGGSLAFSYNDHKRLNRVTDHSGRQIRLTYAQNRLAKVVQPSGAVYQYEYDAQGLLCKQINPLGVNTVKNEYDENGRTVKQSFPDGGVMKYAYDDDQKITVLTQQNGSKITYRRDDKFRTIGTVYPDGEEIFDYNEHNLRTLHIDKRGNATKYSYDKNGNLIRVINPLQETIDTDYNNFNKPEQIKLCGEIKLQTRYDERGNATQISDALERVSKIEYNATGQPVKVIQPDGSEIGIEYDARGNILSMTEPGAVTFYEYDELNRVTATIDGNGNKAHYEYNFKGDIIKVINALGHERKYEYNASGKVTKIIDFDGSVNIREYNRLGKPSKLVDQEGNETTLEYDLMWNVAKQTDANGNTTVFDYDPLQRLIKVTNALGHSVQYAYDPNGNRTAIINPRGDKVHLSYDALNRVMEVIEANGAKTGVAYDYMGQITIIIDALGHESKLVYDKAGQKTSETDFSGRELRYSYNSLGQISEVIDAAGRLTDYEYLPGGLLRKIKYPDGRSAEYAYDKNKNIISQTSQDGYILYYEYDCLNRITRISSNKGQEKRYAYDAVGNVVAMTDANGNSTKYVYSPNGNLLAVIDPLGNKAEYDYDKLGNLIEVKQLAELNEVKQINDKNAKLHITKYVRDELGQIEQIIDALGNKENYTYDETGNVVSKLDKEGYLTEYAYDPTNQLEKVSYADGKSVKLSYNPLKQLTEIRDWLGVTSIEVDETGQAKKVRDFNGKEVEYIFGNTGERTGIKYPDGKVVAYEYDEALRLKTLIDGDSRVEYAYDSNSRLSDKVFSNGVNTKYSYNEMGLISELIHSDKEGILDKYIYSYDSMINKTGIEKYRRALAEDSGKYQYTYDALSRLSGVIKDDKLIKSFGYDEFGNRSFMEDSGVRTDYAYNPLNQLLHSESTQQTQDFSYDARGNLTRILENGQLKNSYEFSPLNRLTKAINAAGQVADYEYNGLGHRVGKQIKDDLNPTKNISYVLDLTKQYHNLLQMSEDGQTKNYAWDFNVVAESGGEGNRFYMQDELGSPLRFTGADGALVDSYAYDEFGRDVFGNQGEAQPFGFTGYQYDNVAQTYFAQAREYDPLAGRFIARDMFKGFIVWPSTFNEYIYCVNNPKIFVDNDGKFLNLILGVIGVIGGAAVGAITSYVTTGEVKWEAVAAGALIGGAIGVTCGIATAALAPAAVGTVTTIASGTLTGMVVGGTVSTFKQLAVDGSVKLQDLAVDILASGVMGTIGAIPGIGMVAVMFSGGITSVGSYAATETINGSWAEKSPVAHIVNILANAVTGGIFAGLGQNFTPDGFVNALGASLGWDVGEAVSDYFRDKLIDNIIVPSIESFISALDYLCSGEFFRDLYNFCLSYVIRKNICSMN
ncbi:MAG: DUF6531 domain-containing protein [Firmicutes bacterium]|nr:DUF6531 domain-containing protein [Bacillota bacterium]